jgi:glycosyltransferase involved in cell wall biosynthesis
MRALAPIYRQEIILEAFAQARIGLKKPAYLVLKIYNQLTPRYKSFLEKRIHELGISDYVRWIEGIPDLEIPTLYALSDAVINFPTADTFPVTFLEAAACECPVITCALPGYENTFVERYFRMVQTDRKEDLSQAIIAELNQESHSRHQLSGARLEVIEHYSESIYITRLLAIYESLR